MTDIIELPDKTIKITIDKSIYDDWVIEKVLYWWSADFIITRENITNTTFQIITFQLKKEHNSVDFPKLKEKISNDFIDYKNRETINRETANLRDLLFAKAFANNDNFVEFTFEE